MKSLINNILLSLAVAICLTLGACAERQPGQAQDHLNGDNTTQTPTETDETTTSPDDPKQEESGSNTDKGEADPKGAEPTGAAAHDDNAATQKANPIDSLSKELSSVQSNTKDLPAQIKNLNEESDTNYLYVIITFIIAIIGLAIAIINYVTIRDHTNRLNRHRSDIIKIDSDLKIDGQKHNQQADSNKAGISQANTELQQLKQRVAALEGQLYAAQRGAQSTTTTTPTSAPASKQPSQHAFFPAPALNGKYLYFPKLSPTRELSFFEAEVTGSTATFRPCVSLQNITSNDSLNNAIEFDGVSKDEARGMVVRTDGQAELRGGKWYVTRRVAIRLTK